MPTLHFVSRKVLRGDNLQWNPMGPGSSVQQLVIDHRGRSKSELFQSHSNELGAKKSAAEKKSDTRRKERGNYKSFDERIEDLRSYKEKHGHTNVSKHDDKSLANFCAHARHARNNIGKAGAMKLTKYRIASLDGVGFLWGPGLPD